MSYTARPKPASEDDCDTYVVDLACDAAAVKARFPESWATLASLGPFMAHLKPMQELCQDLPYIVAGQLPASVVWELELNADDEAMSDALILAIALTSTTQAAEAVPPQELLVSQLYLLSETIRRQLPHTCPNELHAVLKSLDDDDIQHCNALKLRLRDATVQSACRIIGHAARNLMMGDLYGYDGEQIVESALTTGRFGDPGSIFHILSADRSPTNTRVTISLGESLLSAASSPMTRKSQGIELALPVSGQKSGRDAISRRLSKHLGYHVIVKGDLLGRPRLDLEGSIVHSEAMLDALAVHQAHGNKASQDAYGFAILSKGQSLKEIVRSSFEDFLRGSASDRGVGVYLKQDAFEYAVGDLTAAAEKALKEIARLNRAVCESDDLQVLLNNHGDTLVKTLCSYTEVPWIKEGLADSCNTLFESPGLSVAAKSRCGRSALLVFLLDPSEKGFGDYSRR